MDQLSGANQFCPAHVDAKGLTEYRRATHRFGARVYCASCWQSLERFLVRQSERRLTAEEADAIYRSFDRAVTARDA